MTYRSEQIRRRIVKFRKHSPVVDYSEMNSDYDEDQEKEVPNVKIEMFSRQCKNFGPDVTFMLWKLSGDLPTDQLLDRLKEDGYRM